MGLIERDDRRWTIESHDDDYLGHDSATVLDGPDVIEPVEVVPASQLAGAVEALKEIAGDECMIVRDPEHGSYIDTGQPQRIAKAALDRLGGQ